ncbi:hypothetical protein KC19_9G045600 [Ceratodon purpureus]|uniref:Uncharacterized protein n=1 Tax=Ceratodon purpureus TaxID=3225 RepID=A0A8T0GQC0_CERPU|nr:hypothetical protein KC19_9G045600 [Ceratodon purpureus]
MSIPRQRFVGNLHSLVSNELTVLQALLLVLWLICVSVHKLSGAAAELLERWFLSSFEGETSSQGEPADLVTRAEPSSLLSAEVRDGSPQGVAEPIGSLIPSLPDTIVREQVWPKLVSNPSVTQLLQFRHINSSWSQFVGATLEWRALIFVMLDFPGYLQQVRQHGLIFLSATQRLGLEIAHYKLLVSESMEEIESRIEFAGFQTRRLPSYVSLEGCPPCVDEDPGYYDL